MLQEGYFTISLEKERLLTRGTPYITHPKRTSKVCRLNPIKKSHDLGLRIMPCNTSGKPGTWLSSSVTAETFIPKNILIYLYFPSRLVSSPFFSLSLSRKSDPGSHSRLFSPLPATVRVLHFHHEKISAVSSLVDSRRIVPTPRYVLSAVDRFYFSFLLFPFLHINSKSHHGGIRTPGL